MTTSKRHVILLGTWRTVMLVEVKLYIWQCDGCGRRTETIEVCAEREVPLPRGWRKQSLQEDEEEVPTTPYVFCTTCAKGWDNMIENLKV